MRAPPLVIQESPPGLLVRDPHIIDVEPMIGLNLRMPIHAEFQIVREIIVHVRTGNLRDRLVHVVEEERGTAIE